MFDNLAATRAFLTGLIQVPLTDFEVLASGFHCQTLAFRAQEHALVLKISRNGTALLAEQAIREHFGPHPPVPVPAVFFKGHQQGWAWIVQARCSGSSLSQQLTLPRLQQAAQALMALHQWTSRPVGTAATPWVTFLQDLHGFLPEEIRPQAPLTPAVWSAYRERLSGLTAVYEDATWGQKTKVFCWIHGDLKPDHVFIDTDVSGFIDWEMFRPGDFVYDWAVLLLYVPLQEGARHDEASLLRRFLAVYRDQGFALEHLSARLKASFIHSALGALFMWSQTQQFGPYYALKLRLDRLLEIDFEMGFKNPL